MGVNDVVTLKPGGQLFLERDSAGAVVHADAFALAAVAYGVPGGAPCGCRAGSTTIVASIGHRAHPD